MTVVAVACGILAYQIQQGKRQEAALKRIEALGGVPVRTFPRDGVFYSGGKIPEPRFKWLHRLLGEEYFTYVPAINIQNPSITADKIREMIPFIAQIWLKEGLNEPGETNIALIDVGNPNINSELIEYFRSRLPECVFTSTLVGKPAINVAK